VRNRLFATALEVKQELPCWRSLAKVVAAVGL